MILGKKGITPDMEFQCEDCGEKFSGMQVLNGAVELNIIEVNRAKPMMSRFRCECCQDDAEENYD